MVRSTAAVVLAAGAGSRYAGPDHKLLAGLRGRPVVVWAVTAALDAGLAETIVVSGAVDLGPVLADHGLADRVRVVVNPGWADGQATSLAVGIGAVDAAGHAAAVVGLGDQPLVVAEAWRLVATQGLDRPDGGGHLRRAPTQPGAARTGSSGPSCRPRVTRARGACWPGGPTSSRRYRARVSLPTSTRWRI